MHSCMTPTRVAVLSNGPNKHYNELQYSQKRVEDLFEIDFVCVETKNISSERFYPSLGKSLIILSTERDRELMREQLRKLFVSLEKSQKYGSITN